MVGGLGGERVCGCDAFLCNKKVVAFLVQSTPPALTALVGGLRVARTVLFVARCASWRGRPDTRNRPGERCWGSSGQFGLAGKL